MTTENDNLIKVLNVFADEVSKDMDEDYAIELSKMTAEIESGRVKGCINTGKYLFDIVDAMVGNEYQEGVKLGMKVIWDLYTSILEKDVPPSHAKLSFDTLAKAHLNVNRVNVK